MPTLLIPTIHVLIKDTQTHAVINEGDFSPELHEKVDPETIAVLNTDPSEEYRVFKTFKMQKKVFEAGKNYKFPYSVAQGISSRFGCIWPVKKLKGLDRDAQDKLARGLPNADDDKDVKIEQLEDEVTRLTKELTGATDELRISNEDARKLRVAKASLEESIRNAHNEHAKTKAELEELRNQREQVTKTAKPPEAQG